MAIEQVVAPAEVDKTIAAVVPEQGSSALTEPPKPATEGTPKPLAEGAAVEPPGWMAQLKGDLKTEAKLTQFKAVDELGKAYIELERKLGSRGVAVPGEGASAEEMATFRKAIGVPEKPSDYKLEKIPLPTGGELDGQGTAELLKLAHEHNISQGQLSVLYNWFGKNLAAEMQVVKTTSDQAHALLRKELGPAEYDIGMTYMKRAVDKFLTPEGAILYARSGMGNHPETLKMWMAIGKAMGEHLFAEGSRGEKSDSGTFGKRSETQMAQTLYPPKAQ